MTSPITNPLQGRHPLQRFSSPSRGVSALLHTIGLISFSLNFKYLIDYPTRINDSYGWHLQYLTILGLAFAALTFSLGLLADLTASSRLFLAKNISSVLSTPLEVLVTSLYWSLKTYDKRLVLPDWKELQVNPWADFGFHAAPAILLTIDLLFLSPPWTIGVLPSFALSTSLAFAYWYWVELCFKHNGFYPYPLFEILGFEQRILLFLGCALATTVTTLVLKSLYGVLNGWEVPGGKGPLDRQEKSGAIKGEKAL